MRSPFRPALLAVALLHGAGLCLGFEPPQLSIREAISSSSVVILGRVTKTREIERRPYKTIAEAEVELLECLAGDCRNRRSLRVRYPAQTFEDLSLAVEFTVSERVLLALRRPLGKRRTYDFGTRVSSRPDFAFRGSLLPVFSNEGQAGEAFTSVYGGPKERVSFSSLRQWARTLPRAR